MDVTFELPGPRHYGVEARRPGAPVTWPPRPTCVCR